MKGVGQARRPLPLLMRLDFCLGVLCFLPGVFWFLLGDPCFLLDVLSFLLDALCLGVFSYFLGDLRFLWNDHDVFQVLVQHGRLGQRVIGPDVGG